MMYTGIRELIHAGEIDKAVGEIMLISADLLSARPDVAFLLKVHKFVELIRALSAGLYVCMYILYICVCVYQHNPLTIA